MLNRIAGEAGLPFIPYVFWQSLGAGVILFALAAMFGGLPSWKWPHVKVYIVTGLLNFTIPYLIFAFVAVKVPSGVLSLGLSLVPVTIYALALIFRLDRFRVVRFGGILLGLIGVLFCAGALNQPALSRYGGVGRARLCRPAVLRAERRAGRRDATTGRRFRPILRRASRSSGTVTMLVVMVVDR